MEELNKSLDNNNEENSVKNISECLDKIETINETNDTVVKDFFIKETGVTIQEMAILFGQTEEEISKEYGAFKAQKLYSKMDYLIDESIFSYDEFKSKCLLAEKYGFKSITTLPTAVALSKDLLKNKGVKVRCLISYPHGEDFAKVKYYATRNAIKMGADAISVTISPRTIKCNNFKLITKTLNKIIKYAKKLPVTAVLNVDGLSSYEVEKTAKIIAKDCKIYSIMLCSFKEEKTDYLDIVKSVLLSVD
ncbi:MAG: hypothetical protein J6Q58_02675, partial [Clostridia bacterium]|nr:hypothetical protein [Clostridia bacterium]